MADNVSGSGGVGGAVRILAWNILHGGGARRLPEIVLSLLAHEPDVVVLTEFRSRLGGQIRGVLADHGLTHQAATPTPQGSNGLLIASRERLSLRDDAPKGHPAARRPCWRDRWLEVRLPNFTLSGVHVPDDGRPTDRAAYWQSLVAFARARRDEPVLLIGDFNTGRHRADEEGATFSCTAQLGALWTLGYRDAWRELNPTARESTWVSPLGGGFRIDAAHVSAPLLPRLRGARHSDRERVEGVSDHSAVLIDLD